VYIILIVRRLWQATYVFIHDIVSLPYPHHFTDGIPHSVSPYIFSSFTAALKWLVQLLHPSLKSLQSHTQYLLLIIQSVAESLLNQFLLYLVIQSSNANLSVSNHFSFPQGLIPIQLLLAQCWNKDDSDILTQITLFTQFFGFFAVE
jgi:hypothetical protein